LRRASIDQIIGVVAAATGDREGCTASAAIADHKAAQALQLGRTPVKQRMFVIVSFSTT